LLTLWFRNGACAIRSENRRIGHPWKVYGKLNQRHFS
jgi:hypothetical protein